MCLLVFIMVSILPNGVTRVYEAFAKSLTKGWDWEETYYRQYSKHGGVAHKEGSSHEGYESHDTK